MAILVKACVIMHNMVAEDRRDEYQSGMFDLVSSTVPNVQAMHAAKISYDHSDILPNRAG